MRATLKQLFALFDRRTKREFALLLIPIAAISLLEFASLGLLLPVLQILLDPAQATTLPIVSSTYVYFSPARPETFVVAAVVLVGIVFIAKNLALMALVYSQNQFVARRTALFMTELFAFYVRRPYAFFLDHNTAEIQRNLVQATSSAFNNGALAVVRIVLEAAVALAIMVLLFAVNPWLALIVGVVMGTAMWTLNRVMAPHIVQWGERNNALGRDVLQAVSQSIGAIKEIKLLGRESYFIASFANQVSELCRWQSYLQTYSAAPRTLVEAVGVAIFMVALVALFVVGIETRDILPLIAIYGAAAVRLIPSFNRVLQYTAQINTASGAISGLHDHLVTVRRSTPDITTPDMKEAAHNPIQDIQLQNVTFRYGTGRVALAEIDVHIRRGEHVGLVGMSGAGKTTLVDVLLGLLSPQSGQVLVDGHSIAGNLGQWRRRIGYVPQSIFLCDDSIRLNIALGVPVEQLDEQRLQKAVRRAHLEDFIVQLPQGLDTVVGERGARLSGGQRQRIGIARALYHDPDLLILDEATSALDAVSEREIAQSLAALEGEKTVIVITHRLATIRRCRRLLFLRGGRLADAGTYDQIASRNSEFRRLIAAADVNPSDAGNDAVTQELAVLKDQQ